MRPHGGQRPATATGARVPAAVRTAAGPNRAAAVRVEAPARLQMGLIDLRGDLGRLFGGIGVAVGEPRVVVEVRAAEAVDAQGPDAGRAAEFARRFLAYHALTGGADIRVLRTIPAHVGLGSGTQVALAVGRALADVHGLPPDVRSLAPAVGRGGRSGVGSWIFEKGGLVVDGGRREGTRELAPLVGRYPLPARWRCVLVIPSGRVGLSGARERDAFERVPAPPRELVGRISHLVLMGLIPAVVEEDLAGFGRSLRELQRAVGEVFAPVQGSLYAGAEVARLIRLLDEAGAHGAGQSSWGPTVYGLVEGEAAADELALRANDWVGPAGRAFAVSFDNSGAVTTPI